MKNTNINMNSDTNNDTNMNSDTPDAQRILLETIAGTMSTIARQLEALAQRTPPANSQDDAAPPSSDTDGDDSDSDSADPLDLDDLDAPDDGVDDLYDAMDDLVDDFGVVMDDFIDLMDDIIERADTTSSKRVKVTAQEWPWSGTWTTRTIVAVPAQKRGGTDNAATGDNGATGDGDGADDDEDVSPQGKWYRFGNFGRGFVELRTSR